MYECDYFSTMNVRTVILHKSHFWINQLYLQNVSQGCENWSTCVTYSNVKMELTDKSNQREQI